MIENSAGWRYVQSADSVADYPTVSEHNAGKFQDLKSIVDGKAPLTHTHPQSQVTGLDAALAGKAPVSHTHPQSQVTGLDAALAGKAPLSTLNTRVPENLALRRDTTVGTRIFAGNTMIYGITGRRIIVGDSIPALSGSGNVFITRYGDFVTMEMSIYRMDTSSGGKTLFSIPVGFRPSTTLFSSMVANRDPASVAFMIDIMSNGSVQEVGIPTEGRHYGSFSWITNNAWPSVLPGIPA